ncbi:MAG: TIM barrel protein [Acidobacteriota bacterium]|nr:TIM barrel protein [Acidobacteriota bacterium]
MKKLLVGNAPCSWGTLEHQDKSKQVPFDHMLDELVETGYSGTGLGDWGYMPTDPVALKAELAKRNNLVMLGAFVPVALKYASTHVEGVATAVKTARLLAAVATTPSPYLVLADDNGTDPVRTRLAGRVTAQAGLTPTEWKTFASGADQIARAVLDETGLRTVFHHHCAGYVETPDEIATLLDLTNPDRLGLVFDTGHYYRGAGIEDCDLSAVLNRFAGRIWYIHLKDLEPNLARRARKEQWDYFTGVRNGVYCELGMGCVDFPALLRWLAARDYKGYVLVEQDVLPGMGTPRESALRNREYLRSIEANFA